ncbi:hypothetical protein J3L16_15610 [Alteromonas sp. 5E99-2]|nr:hypothetical protein [Alteromonas sp. 5E99-2]
MYVLSERAKKTIESKYLKEVIFSKVDVVDLNNSNDIQVYWVMTPLLESDCIDIGKSSILDEDVVIDLVLSKERLPASSNYFSITNKPSFFVSSERFKENWQAAQLIGLDFDVIELK